MIVLGIVNNFNKSRYVCPGGKSKKGVAFQESKLERSCLVILSLYTSLEYCWGEETI